MFETARTSKLLIRVSVLALLAASMGACSSAPDWVDPTTWVGGSSNEPSTTPDNPTADQTSDTSPEGKTVAEASDKYPELADTPDKAPAATSTDEQKQVANGLVGDRTAAQYSAEALRASTVDAPPPPPAPADQTLPPDSNTSASASASDQQTAAADGAATDSGAGSADTAITASTPAAASEPITGRAPMPGTLPVMDSSASTASATAASPPATPAVQSASIAPPAAAPGANTMPAAAVAPPPAPVRAMPTEDASLGFQPSHAPPLDPSISQYVPSSVIARYQRTASLSGSPGVAPARTASRVSTATYPGQSSSAPMAVVTFAQSGTALNAEAHAQVHAAVQAFRAAGSQGYVRVVGHSASLGSTSQEQLSRSFEESQACANAVAQALIKEGVPANKVLVEAVGGANGESGGRRAEIFLQG